MDNKKISEMPITTPGSMDDMVALGKYYIPVLTPLDQNNKNNRFDIGEMFLRMKLYVATAVSDEIQRRIDAGLIGTGGSSGGGSQGGSSESYAELNNRVTNMEMTLTNWGQASYWPKHYIRKVSQNGDHIDYVLETSPGSVSSTSANNPLIIEQVNIDLPNFYVTLAIYSPIYNSTTNKLNASVQYTISSRQGTILLLGGTVGELVISGSFTVGAGTYTFTTQTIDLSSVTLNSSNNISTTATVTMISDSDISEGTTIDQAAVTCSIQGVRLGQTAYYVTSSGGGNSTSVSGQIKLTSNNGS